MVDVRSALPDQAWPVVLKPGIRVSEVTGRDLVQLVAWPAAYAHAAEKLATLVGCGIPNDMRTAVTTGEASVFRVGPERLWLTTLDAARFGPRLRAAFSADEAIVVELGHSRVILRIAGPRATALLVRAVAIDLDPAAFPPAAFAQTALHHAQVLLHHASNGMFDLYIPRSYALSLWQWLQEAADLCPQTD